MIMEKTLISAEDLLEDSFRLGMNILESGFKPSIIVAIWRGGAPVGMAVQEILSYCRLQCDHIAIRTSSYERGAYSNNEVVIHGLGYVIEKITNKDKILIVDDVFDTGHTIKAVIESIRKRSGDNCPKDIRSAVPWFKPLKNKTDISPDYYLRETSDWLVFPHELDSLNLEEMKEFRPDLYNIFEDEIVKNDLKIKNQVDSN